MTDANAPDAQHSDYPADDSRATDPELLRELAKRRGLYFPANEAYGGVAGLYSYGPAGAALKRNVEDAWRERFVVREGNREVETPTVLPEAVFAASGHLDAFDDLLVACPDCDRRHRADHLVAEHADVADAESLPTREVEALLVDYDVRCPDCEAPLAGQSVRDFALMFETRVGPGDGQRAVLRPETAQGTLVEFPRLKEYARGHLPFGVAQVGRGYRNEISPRRSVLRLRELTMAELQQFVHPDDDHPPFDRVAETPLRLLPATAQVGDPSYTEATVQEVAGELMNPWVAYYLGVTRRWLADVGVDPERLRFRQHRVGERAHYAADCWDAEARIHREWVELAGIADRADHDLGNHADHGDAEFAVFDRFDEPEIREETVVDPDMSYLGPEFGDRAPPVVDALESLAETDPEAFDAEEVTVELDASDVADRTDAAETVTVPAEAVEVRTERRRVHGEHVRPHVVEPSFGVDRVVYAVLAHALGRDAVDGEPRTRLALARELAPTAVAVLPLGDAQAAPARSLVEDLRTRGLAVEYDDSGSIGRRYRRQDEVGTPFCVTVDEQTADDQAATIRERDSTDQVRVPLADLPALLADLRQGEATFAAVRERYD